MRNQEALFEGRILRNKWKFDHISSPTQVQDEHWLNYQKIRKNEILKAQIMKIFGDKRKGNKFFFKSIPC